MPKKTDSDKDKNVYRSGPSIVRRSSLEDPKKPGYLKRGLLLGPVQFQAASAFGLKNPRTDNPIGIKSTSRDPSWPRQSEVPEDLRKELTAAKAQYELAEQAAEVAEKVLNEAAKELGDFNKRFGDSLTAAGSLKQSALGSEVDKAYKSWRDSRALLDEARRDVFRMELRVETWRREEYYRREAEAEEKRRAKKPSQAASLKDRIKDMAGRMGIGS